MVGIARRLHRARRRYPGRDLGAALGRRRKREVGGADAGNLDVQVDPVEQGAGHLGLIIGGAARRTAARQCGIGEVAAAARVHRRDQLDPRREGDVGIGTRHADLAGLERLAQRIEHRALEFGKLVEEQHAEMRQADLARTHFQAAPDQGRHRRRMMRASERPPSQHPSAVQFPRDRGDHRHFERFCGFKRRQYPRQAGSEQRLARARRPAHQEIMTARGGNLERALGDLLPFDLPQIGPADGRLGLPRKRRGQQTRALQMRDQCQQIRGGKHFDITRPSRFGTLCNRADQPLALPRGMKRGEQDSGRRRDPPVEPELADRDIMRQRLLIDRTDRREQTERDWKVEMRPFLGQIGRRQIDGDDLGRKREADCGQGAAHAFAALGHRLVGQPDDHESRDARRQLHLHLDGACLEPEIGNRGHQSDHQRRPRRTTVACDATRYSGKHPPSSAERC